MWFNHALPFIQTNKNLYSWKCRELLTTFLTNSVYMPIKSQFIINNYSKKNFFHTVFKLFAIAYKCIICTGFSDAHEMALLRVQYHIIFKKQFVIALKSVGRSILGNSRIFLVLQIVVVCVVTWKNTAQEIIQGDL